MIYTSDAWGMFWFAFFMGILLDEMIEIIEKNEIW